MLNERLQRMRNKLFDSRPCITAERLVLQTEAYQKFAGEAVPIFRAKVVRYIMEHMTTLLMDDELIVGTPTNKYRGASLFPEFQSSTEFYLPELDAFPVRKTDPYDISPEDRETISRTLEYWKGKSMQDMSKEALPPEICDRIHDDIITVGLTNGVSGETTCDHEKLVTVGLKGYIEECRENIRNTVSCGREDQGKIDFWKACIIQSEGLIEYARRMAAEAEAQAAACADEKRKKELLTIAENCRVVPENPPRSFQQALQLIWFVHVYFHIEVCTTANGFGRFDQYMWPFYEKDVLIEKNITKDEALEMLECFYLKACEVFEVRDKWYATSFAGYPMWELLVVGGQTPEGEDATNELSYLCLDAASELQTTQPVMAVRVWEGTPEALIRKGCKMIQEGQANPGFFNDNVAMQMALGKGCTMEEARDWTIVGCIQPGPGGGGTDGSPDAGYVNMGKMLEFVLHNGVDPQTGKLMGLETGDPRAFRNIEEFKDALKKQILHHYKMVTTGYNIMQSMHMTRYPVIFASMVTRGCVEAGRSVQEGGARYSTAGLYITGAANMADSIAAIDTCVFQDRDITMAELIEALDKNFEGEERLRQMLLNKPPKFGNDNAYVDGIYREMMQFIAQNVQTWPDARGGAYSFFQHGGEHIQINVVDDETLREAQRTPEKYKGLMVRVAGYMAYFTELDKNAQDTIIYRTAHFKEV